MDLGLVVGCCFCAVMVGMERKERCLPSAGTCMYTH